MFVTFRKLGGKPFSAWARGVVLEHCLYDNGKKFELHACVVMPDHVHLLFTSRHDPEGWPFSLPQILKGLKGASARSINRGLGLVGSVWQDEFFDHVLRSDESLHPKIDYIRQNPVKRGLANKPEDYPWLWVQKGSWCRCGTDTPIRLLPEANLQFVSHVTDLQCSGST